MALHTRKRLRKPGLPEVVAVSLVVMTCISVTAWWRDVSQPEWGQSEGRILTCVIRSTHYNAQDYRRKVMMTYEYVAGGQTRTGSFAGFWPVTGSVNALPEERFGELESKSFGLTVYYDPHNPGMSQLHVVGADNELLLGGVALACTLFTVFYCVRVYPAWRRC